MKRSHQNSQNFLRDPRLVKELVGHTTIGRDDIVYDIGAGSGTITSVLASRAKHVVAVEYEPRAAQKLRQNMSTRDNVEVIHGDFLSLDLPSTPYKIMANIPFHLSSKIVRKLTESPHVPAATYLIVQRQFATKLLIGETPFTGLLGAMIAPWFTVRIRRKLERIDFWPHPAVDTVFIELIPRDDPALPRNQQSAYGVFVERCFHDQVYFAKLRNKHSWLIADARPSQLTLADWVRLYSLYHDQGISKRAGTS